MKRSKIFLGVTTALLAVAGVTAAKHYGPTTPRYYVSFAGNYCLPVTGITCTQGGNVQCTFVTSGIGHKSVNVYTQGPVGAISGTGACATSSLLKYHTEP